MIHKLANTLFNILGFWVFGLIISTLFPLQVFNIPSWIRDVSNRKNNKDIHRMHYSSLVQIEQKLIEMGIPKESILLKDQTIKVETDPRTSLGRTEGSLYELNVEGYDTEGWTTEHADQHLILSIIDAVHKGDTYEKESRFLGKQRSFLRVRLDKNTGYDFVLI